MKRGVCTGIYCCPLRSRDSLCFGLCIGLVGIGRVSLCAVHEHTGSARGDDHHFCPALLVLFLVASAFYPFSSSLASCSSFAQLHVFPSVPTGTPIERPSQKRRMLCGLDETDLARPVHEETVDGVDIFKVNK